MTETTKKYTDEQTAEMVEAYTAATNDDERKAVVAEFSEKFDKPAASIRKKLSLEGVYVRPEYLNKRGEKSRNKATITKDIAALLNLKVEQVAGIERATKQELINVENALKAMKA